VFGQENHASGMSYALQGSYRLALGAVYLEPEAGVSCTRLDVANQATNVGELAFGAATLTLAHVGARLGAEVSGGGWTWRPYALGAVWREWRSGADIAVPQGPVITPTGLAGFEQVGLGMNFAFGQRWSGFAQGEGVFGRRIAGLAASGGLRFEF
jgi:outer membrane autotransporter protein